MRKILLFVVMITVSISASNKEICELYLKNSYIYMQKANIEFNSGNIDTYKIFIKESLFNNYDASTVCTGKIKKIIDSNIKREQEIIKILNKRK